MSPSEGIIQVGCNSAKKVSQTVFTSVGYEMAKKLGKQGFGTQIPALDTLLKTKAVVEKLYYADNLQDCTTGLTELAIDYAIPAGITLGLALLTGGGSLVTQVGSSVIYRLGKQAWFNWFNSLQLEDQNPAP